MNIVKYYEFVNQGNIDIKSLMDITETTNSPDLEEISKSADYKKVVELGEIALPYLLETVKNESSFWLRALSEITGIKQNTSTQSSKERKDFWKKWSKDNGFV